MSYELLVLEHESRVLAGNPLGDPCRREIQVLAPRGPAGAPLPVVYLLSGFGSRGRDLLAARALGENLAARLSRLVSEGVLPPVYFVLPDCSTRYGGSQYLDSPACGPYQRYLVDEVVATVDRRLRTQANARGRAVMGKSSGGYGALLAALRRPGVFGHVLAHSPDAGFEHCYLSLLTRALDVFAARGGIDALAGPGYDGPFDAAYMEAMSLVAMAACYAPEPVPERAGALARAFVCDPETGRFRDEVWREWRRHDPVRIVEDGGSALHRLGVLFLDVGRRDEYGMRWGVRALHRALRVAGIAHVFEEHDGAHQGIEPRFARSLAALGRHWSATCAA